MNDQENEKDIELDEDVETSDQIIENEKKQEEISIKKSKACQFRTSHPETLEINENDPFYRDPLVNIIENKDLYYILVELPGLDKKHVKISLQQEVLEVRGEIAIKDKEKKEEKKDKEKKEKDKKKEKYKEIKGDYIMREIRSSNFFRCFHLPEDISPEEIEASFKNGILRLKIPKKTSKISEKQEIEIK